MALLAQYFVPYLHILDDCELFCAGRFHKVSRQLSAREVVPVRLPLRLLKCDLIDVLTLVAVDALDSQKVSCIRLCLFKGRSKYDSTK